MSLFNPKRACGTHRIGAATQNIDLIFSEYVLDMFAELFPTPVENSKAGYIRNLLCLHTPAVLFDFKAFDRI